MPSGGKRACRPRCSAGRRGAEPAAGRAAELGGVMSPRAGSSPRPERGILVAALEPFPRKILAPLGMLVAALEPFPRKILAPLGMTADNAPISSAPPLQ